MSNKPSNDSPTCSSSHSLPSIVLISSGSSEPIKTNLYFFLLGIDTNDIWNQCFNLIGYGHHMCIHLNVEYTAKAVVKHINNKLLKNWFSLGCTNIIIDIYIYKTENELPKNM